jgi:dolichyl-phosphate-mannose-protein mannosyltransferase/NHL repeat-containing protein
MTKVEWRWLRLLLLIGLLAGVGTGQYWLSVQHVARWSALAWSGAGLCFVLLYALGRDARELPSPQAAELSRNLEWALAAVVFGVGLFFGLYHITQFPPGLNHDAAWEGMYAIRILRGQRYTPYASEAWGRETFTFYLRALSIKLLGPTQLAVEAPSMVAGIVVLPFLYWWARTMFGARVALVATLFLGASGWHLIFSRTGWRSDFQPLFTTITCCFFMRAMLTASVLDFAVSGIALAVTLNTYNGARAFPLLFPLWLAAALLQPSRRRGFVRRYAMGLVAMALTFGVTIAPLAWYAATHWVQFQGRAAYLAGSSALLDNLRATVLLFNYWGNGDDFFLTTPGLEYAPGLFLFIGVLWVLARWRDERAQFLLFGFLVNVLPGILSKPNMNRNIGAMPFVYFFVALGVVFVVNHLWHLVPRVGHVVAGLFVVAVGAVAIQDTYAQYLGPQPRRLWGYYPETTVIGHFMKTLVPSYKIFIGDTPYFPRDALTFLSYQGTGDPEIRRYLWLDDVTTLLRTELVPEAGKGFAFILETTSRGPRVFAEMQRRFPRHQVVDLRYPENGPVFAKALLVPAEAVAGQPSKPLPLAEEVVNPEAAPGRLRQPRALVVAGDGLVFVCDFGNNRMQAFGRDLSFIRQWGMSGSASGQFNQPCGVTMSAAGEVVVADTWNQRIQVFSQSGAHLREWESGFFAPRGVAVDSKGSVFVTDSGNNRVVRFSAAGQKELQWGGRGSDSGQFIEPIGIAVDAADQVYVSDNGNGRLQIFTRDGKVIRTFPVEGWRQVAFSEPTITLDAHGAIWVTVPALREVRSYDTTGKLLRTITGTSVPGVTFATPMGIAYDASAKELVVSDLEGRLVRIPAGG